MGITPFLLDGHHEDPMALHIRTFYRVRDIRPGDEVTLTTAEDPTYMMESLGLQTRHRIRWQVEHLGVEGWRVQIRHRDDGEANNLRILLGSDHERLDRLFAQALDYVNAGDVAAAAPLAMRHMLGLRRHVHVENDVLAVAFDLPRDIARRDPVSIMLDEHARILEQVDILASLFADGLPEAGEAAPFFALLSAALAKHEGREEQNLFPVWDSALRIHHAGKDAEALMARVKGILAGSEDHALPVA